MSLPPGELKTRKIETSFSEQVLRGMLDQSQFAIQVADELPHLFDAKVGGGGPHDKVRYMVNSGRKNVTEDLAALPSAILCAPLDSGMVLRLSRFHVAAV